MVLEDKTYVPTLAIRPSEMNGLEFLPGAAKDRMTPCVLLAPWANSTTLDRALTRLERAFPNRRYFLDIDPDYEGTNDDNGARRELRQLKDPTHNYGNWVEFIRDHKLAMPCLQFSGLTQTDIRRQVDAFQEFGRSYCARILLQNLPPNTQDIVDALAASGTADFAIILEGGWTEDPLSLAAKLSGVLQSLGTIDATIPVALSCTSIPKMFSIFSGKKPTTVPFTNRILVDQVARTSNRQRIIYGDWGSTRPRQNKEFASRPLDRVDYPTTTSWLIARNKDASWTFSDAADAIVSDPRWDGTLGIWGEEMIKNTTINAALGIDTPQKNVASRVNIHLFRQAFYGEPPRSASELDEDWVD